jgi:hypothetical protein
MRFRGIAQLTARPGILLHIETSHLKGTYLMKSLFTFTFILSYTLLFAACSSDKSEDEQSSASDGDTDRGPAFGFESPDEALDAYTKALREGDEEGFRKIAANYFIIMEGLDEGISFHNDKTPEEAAKATLLGIADVQGLAEGALSKRLPAEIDGDVATIVNLHEDHTIEDQFIQFEFEKARGKWNIVGADDGDAKDLPGDHEWDKNIADVSDEMLDFIGEFNGESDAVKAALANHAADDADVGLFKMYGCKQPAVVKKEEVDGAVRYTLHVIVGMSRQKFFVSWKDGKITSIKDLDLIGTE